MQGNLQIVFRAPMSSPNIDPYIPPTAPDVPPPEKQSWSQRHGTTAQWLAIGATLLVSVITNVVLIHNRSVDTDVKRTDKHTDALVDKKLNPAIAQVNQHTDGKMTELG